MDRQITTLLALVAACALLSSGAYFIAHDGNDPSEDRDQMTQISILQGLMKGDYYGSVKVSDLLKHGDIGLGTFDRLDGEMIVLDGVCYQAVGDGTVRVADSDTTVPFACVTYLDEEFAFGLQNIVSMNDLKEKMDARIATHGSNYMYVATVKGTFDTLKVRSELAQDEPYRELTEVMETDERRYDHAAVTGTVVAVYCPAYMSAVNSAGWHFHFISDDRVIGGHVLDVSFTEASAILDKTTSIDILLPEGEFFKNADLRVSQEDIEDVEG